MNDKPRMRGRPPKYETAEELQAAIDDYFLHGVKLRKVVLGPPNKRYIDEIPVPTITGLVLHLGFADRHSFYDLEKQDKFSHTIKMARTFIENEYEEQLQTGNSTGAIFALKNFGWRDDKGIDLTSQGDKLPITMIQLIGSDDDDEPDYIELEGGDGNSSPAQG